MHASPIQVLPWQELTEAQRRSVRALSITPEQVEYAGAGDKQLAVVEAERSSDLVGLVILSGEAVVGFLVLKRGVQAPNWASSGAAVISGMRIDLNQQGRGIGSGALMALPAWLLKNWPSCTELALSVDEENIRGIKAYLAAGFKDHGIRVSGRVGWVRYMSRALQPIACGTIHEAAVSGRPVA